MTLKLSSYLLKLRFCEKDRIFLRNHHLRFVLCSNSQIYGGDFCKILWPSQNIWILPKFNRVPFTIVIISLISTMVNGTLLNFGKRYEDDFRVIFEQWPKLHMVLDALSNQKLLKGVYYSSKDRWSQICKEKMYIDKKRFHFEWYSCLFGAVPTFFYQMEWVWQWLRLQFGGIGRLGSEESREGTKRKWSAKGKGDFHYSLRSSTSSSLYRRSSITPK